MKKIIIALISASLSLLAFGQSITINNANINIDDGTYLIIPGDWKNNTNSNITQHNGSLVRFNGNSVQEIRSSTNSFSTIEIDNSYLGGNYSILLDDNLSISNNLLLTDGIVFTDENTVTLQAAATTNIGNANSFIDGTISKLSTTSFTFPTGNVNTRDIGSGLNQYKIWAPFAATSVSSSNIAVRYRFSNETLPTWWYHDWTHETPLTHTTDREFWLVESNNNLSSATLYWRGNNPCSIHDFCDGSNNFLSAHLTAAYWDNKWYDAGGTPNVTVAPHNEGYITSGDIPFGSKNQRYITFAGKDLEIPLPVELINFSASCDKAYAELVWRTASERNNEGFIIEKSSDTRVWNEIGFVEGAGDSNIINTYTYSDNTPASGNTYFRLKQIDFDGTYEYSKIISINCEKYIKDNVDITIYPNPFRDHIRISGDNLPGEYTEIHIYSLLGSLLKSHKEYNHNGTLYTRFDLRELPPSMYLVRVVSANYTGVFKIEKQ